MCGIAGFSLHGFSRNGSLDQQTVRSLLQHRGPDDFGTFLSQDTKLGLFHARLSILDPSPDGHQPMFSASGNSVIVFNGEIYNFYELRSELEISGYSFASQTDTEVLLSLYEKFKSDFPSFSLVEVATKFVQSLNGIFAFAIWDFESDSLLLCRDGLGVKPLYYINDNNGFCFASEAKVFSSHHPSIDIPSLNRYLTFLWNPGCTTADAHVVKVSPGEAIIVTNGVIKERFFWYTSPTIIAKLSKKPFSTRSESIAGSEYFLRQAVHRQLVSDYL